MTVLASGAAPVPPRQAVGNRLMAGPPGGVGHEPLAAHQRRLSVRPSGGPGLIELLRQSGLRGRGGAWFPTWRKWEAVARHSDGNSIVVVNASEGEPLSKKDGILITLRTHLVLDGAALAAETLGAKDIVLYLAKGSETTRSSVEDALRERRLAHLPEPSVQIVWTDHRYISGESSAVVNRVSGGPAKPRFSLQRAAESGVDGRPTLVQNAETLAHVALIARYGSNWFRQLGTPDSPGSALMTLSGNVNQPGVYEVDLGAQLDGVLEAAGGTVSPAGGALIGGYFGNWLAASSLAGLPLDPEHLQSQYGASLGCGILAILPQSGCAIVESASIIDYLAGETADQCGPCVNGLAALAETMRRIAASNPESTDIDRVWRWTDMVRGRGACHHPDGAVGQLSSALSVFKDHLRSHLSGQRCYGVHVGGFPQPPRSSEASR